MQFPGADLINVRMVADKQKDSMQCTWDALMKCLDDADLLVELIE